MYDLWGVLYQVMLPGKKCGLYREKGSETYMHEIYQILNDTHYEQILFSKRNENQYSLEMLKIS